MSEKEPSIIEGIAQGTSILNRYGNDYVVLYRGQVLTGVTGRIFFKDPASAMRSVVNNLRKQVNTIRHLSKVPGHRTMVPLSQIRLWAEVNLRVGRYKDLVAAEQRAQEPTQEPTKEPGLVGRLLSKLGGS